jgi:hypothetical protein
MGVTPQGSCPRRGPQVTRNRIGHPEIRVPPRPLLQPIKDGVTPYLQLLVEFLDIVHLEDDLHAGPAIAGQSGQVKGPLLLREL